MMEVEEDTKINLEFFHTNRAFSAKMAMCVNLRDSPFPGAKRKSLKTSRGRCFLHTEPALATFCE